MATESTFRGIITFMDRLGIYDVILPFLLVFTIVFAILEKTKILGIEKVDGKETTKKNIDAMVAFVVAFLVIASTQLVRVINEVMANVVLLLILAISFLLLVGVFFGDKEFTLDKYPKWVTFFMVLMFIGVVIIFLNAMDWLKFIWILFENWNTEWAATIFFFAIVLGFMWYVVADHKSSGEKKS